MNMFDKETWDVSRVFLAYLTFLGNARKVAIALEMPAEVVEVLAAKEDWPAKLRTYLALRHEEAMPSTERRITRTVTHIQACHLQDIISRLIDYMYTLPTPKNLMDWFSPRSPRTNQPEFRAKIVLDLLRALNLATRVVNRTATSDSGERREETAQRDWLTICAASARAMDAIDKLPGMDSVALAKDSLAQWDSDSGESQHGETTV